MIKQASETFLTDIASNEKTLVMVSTPMCGPCRQMKANVLPEFEDDHEIIIIDATTQQPLVAMIQEDAGRITSVPVFVLYKKGNFARRRDGAMSEGELLNFIEG